MMAIQVISHGGQRLTFDTDHFSTADGSIFEPDDLKRMGWLVDTRSGGRGTIWVFRSGHRSYVLRHYRRGGLVAKLLHDRYLRVPDSLTRPAREWRLLRRMRGIGLPVPVPAAWRVVRSGLATYCADLITELIPDCRSLGEILLSRPLGGEEWARLGEVLRRFHDCQVWHADLNASNILLNGEGRCYLVDFDRARIRPGERWKAGNLNRLQRSLRKQKRLHPTFHYQDEDFAGLMRGYSLGAGETGAGQVLTPGADSSRVRDPG